MTFWVITDTHFGHHAMHYHCDRPNGFEETLLLNIQNVVKEDDVLIHLGDFCFYREEYWHSAFMSACKGKRWLIRGNHDRKSNTWYLNHGWDFVGERAHLDMFGAIIVVTHKPITEDWNYVNVHGHLHNNNHHPEIKKDAKNRLVFIEHHYTPIKLRKIMEIKK